jgi:hypothetical protein
MRRPPVHQRDRALPREARESRGGRRDDHGGLCRHNPPRLINHSSPLAQPFTAN